jgi:two-component system cell cycle response regulator
MKILLADDDPVSLRIMERMLQKCGYHVITVRNGRQAAEELSKKDSPRLALIDWMMPELDGLGLCREMRRRQDGAYIYMVLLTARESQEDIVEGLKAGADNYLTKPCHPLELQARLHSGRRILELEDKLVEAREGMRFKATHDALTSLWDRGAILALLRSELCRSIRERTSVSMLLCDIDHFKHINDVHGHLMGDKVLEEVSKRLRNAVRAHDAVGRYGGEEFLIILNSCAGGDLNTRAEEVRKAISCSPFPLMNGPISVSLSVGAITIENWDKSLPLEPYLKRVDEALYRAKAAGRDQVAYAELSFDIPLDAVPVYQSVQIRVDSIRGGGTHDGRF